MGLLTVSLRSCVLGVAAALNACSGILQSSQEAPEPTTAAPSLADDVDHVVVAIDSLEGGIEMLQQLTGVKPVYGGAHPGRGTHNALLSLGPGVYLELIAPNPADSVRTPRTTSMAAYKLPHPIGWAVRSHDADSLRASLMERGLDGGNVAPGSRERPDGSTLRWRTLTPWGQLNSSILPFYIQWAPGYSGLRGRIRLPNRRVDVRWPQCTWRRGNPTRCGPCSRSRPCERL